MTENAAPPMPIPPAAQSPWPAHPLPQPEREAPPPAPKVNPAVPGIGGLGMTLIGGAIIAAAAFAIIPLFRRKPQPKPQRKRARKGSAKGTRKSGG